METPSLSFSPLPSPDLSYSHSSHGDNGIIKSTFFLLFLSPGLAERDDRVPFSPFPQLPLGVSSFPFETRGRSRQWRPFFLFFPFFSLSSAKRRSFPLLPFLPLPPAYMYPKLVDNEPPSSSFPFFSFPYTI